MNARLEKLPTVLLAGLILGAYGGSGGSEGGEESTGTVSSLSVFAGNLRGTENIDGITP